MKRRKFLTAAASALAAVIAFPKTLFARPTEAFAALSTEDAVAKLYAGSSYTLSDRVKLKAPAIAENGAVVPVTISTDLENVTNISVLVNENPNPLSASFDLQPVAIAMISTRLKMGKTSNVTAIVSAGGKLYAAEQEVKVTIGGCGG